MESSWRDFFIDMAVHGFIFKNKLPKTLSQNERNLLSHFQENDTITEKIALLPQQNVLLI